MKTEDAGLVERTLAVLKEAQTMAKLMDDLTSCRGDDQYVWGVQNKIAASIAELEAADRIAVLSDQAVAEPVAWQCRGTNGDGSWSDWRDCSQEHAQALQTPLRQQSKWPTEVRALYAAPPPVSLPAGVEADHEAFQEMLAALKQMEAEMRAGFGSSYGETREQVRRAIRKAEAALAAQPASDAVPPEWEGPLTADEQAMIDTAWETHKAAAPHLFQANGPGVIGSDLCQVCGREDHEHKDRYNG